MISRIAGTLRRRNPEDESVEVDVGGLWYQIHLPTFVWRAVASVPLDERLELETFYYVAERQPIPKLVGFLRPLEKEFFRKFIEVPDLGPTKALKALIFSVSTIAWWIENEDKAALRKLPQIGPRLAETIVAHLRGKVVQEALLQDEHFAAEPPPPAPPTAEAAREDAVAALVSLGYKRAEAERWVEEILRERAIERVEEIIQAVFRRMHQPR